MRSEGLSQGTILVTPSGIKLATFRLVAQGLNQLRYRVPPYLPLDISTNFQNFSSLRKEFFGGFLPYLIVIHGPGFELLNIGVPSHVLRFFRVQHYSPREGSWPVALYLQMTQHIVTVVTLTLELAPPSEHEVTTFVTSLAVLRVQCWNSCTSV